MVKQFLATIPTVTTEAAIAASQIRTLQKYPQAAIGVARKITGYAPDGNAIYAPVQEGDSPPTTFREASGRAHRS